MAEKYQAPRIVVFTHDTFGLGHIRRCLHIIQALARHESRSAILLVSGCPALHMIHNLPPNCDYIKIPTIVKTGFDGNKPPHLPVPLTDVSTMRANLIQEAVMTFRPDVFLVDNFPLGSGRELLPTLRAFRELSGQTILGLRDIMDAPETVIADWSRRGIHEVLESLYDHILVYGIPEILDIAEAYQLPATVASRISYCGYVTAPLPDAEATIRLRGELKTDRPSLLVTTGGGGDGYPLIKTFLEALPLLPRLSAIVITGPLMTFAERSELEQLADINSGVRIIDFVPDLRPYIAVADVVIAMAGYNTTAEIAAIRPKALLIPRTWRYGDHRSQSKTGLEWEQMLRARALEKLGLVDVLEPKALTPEILAQSITRLLARPEAVVNDIVELNGAENAACHILNIAYRKRGGHHVMQ